MALCVEEEVWKCPKHPSKRRLTGICHVCLRERLSLLCPDCAHMRPCSCWCADAAGIGSVGRVSTLIESEPTLRGSRSVAAPFLRLKPAFDHRHDSLRKTSFWSLLKHSNDNKSSRGEDGPNGVVVEDDVRRKNDEEERRRMMRKSRSVAVTSESSVTDVRSPSKGKSWYFPSPIKVFRQSISRGMGHERSPLYRG